MSAAAGLKEDEEVMQEEEGEEGVERVGASLFFFYEHTSVFTSSIQASGEGRQLSQALQHYKSFHSLSVSLTFPFSPVPFSCQSGRSGRSFSLVWPLFLSLRAAERRPGQRCSTPAVQQAVDLELFLWA